MYVRKSKIRSEAESQRERECDVMNESRRYTPGLNPPGCSETALELDVVQWSLFQSLFYSLCRWCRRFSDYKKETKKERRDDQRDNFVVVVHGKRTHVADRCK